MRKAVFALLLSLPFAAFAQTAPAKSSDDVQLERFDPKMVDPNIDPCVDFFAHACSKRIKADPIPSDEIAWGAGIKLVKWNTNILHAALEEASNKKNGRNANEQKIGDYYTACMNESARNTAGAKPIQAHLAMVDKMKSTAELASILASLHSNYRAAWLIGDNQTDAPMLGFAAAPDYNDAKLVVALVDQGGLGMPNRDFYLKDDEKSTKLRASYSAYIAKLMQLAGESAEQAKADATKIMALETELAKAQMDNISRRDPKNLNNRHTLDQLRALTPSFNWATYLKAVGAPASPVYIVNSPAFMKALDAQIKAQPLDTWKAYLRWNIVRKSSSYLSDELEQASFDFLNKGLYGQQEMTPRWRRCTAVIDRDLGEALGQAYVAKVFTPEAKAQAKRLVDDVEAAMGKHIDEIYWMQPQTKKAAHEKLDAVLDKIGYPDQWRDYSALQITPASYVDNYRRSTTFEFKRQLAKVGKPLNRYEWTMTPPEVNAYEDPQNNTENFPAGILQAPFFEASAPDSVNYGAIGMVIGHETIHGFDDQGRKFDKDGNLKDWWTEADAKAYEQRGDCIAEQYTQEIPEAGVKQNGRLTQGEDTGDNGGMHIALTALQEALKRKGETLETKGKDGLTNLQRFFYGYATIWCGDIRPEAMRTIVLTNPHSLNKYRVNNVIANMEEFSQAFSCKVGQPMSREKKCRVW